MRKIDEFEAYLYILFNKKGLVKLSDDEKRNIRRTLRPIKKKQYKEFSTVDTDNCVIHYLFDKEINEEQAKEILVKNEINILGYVPNFLAYDFSPTGLSYSYEMVFKTLKNGQVLAHQFHGIDC